MVVCMSETKQCSKHNKYLAISLSLYNQSSQITEVCISEFVCV